MFPYWLNTSSGSQTAMGIAGAIQMDLEDLVLVSTGTSPCSYTSTTYTYMSLLHVTVNLLGFWDSRRGFSFLLERL